MTHVERFPWNLFLEVCGVMVQVRCLYERCCDGIRRYYFPLISDTPWRSPDITVFVDWDDSDRFLYRARPTQLPPELIGVWVRTHGGDIKPWRSHMPPLPPLHLPPFRGRFFGLHAAAVVFAPASPSASATLIIGASGSGKTSLAMEACNSFGAALLTDETVLVHNRTNLVEPLPRAVGIKSDEGQAKEVFPANEVVSTVARTAAAASRLLFLEPASGAPPSLQRLTPTQAFAALANHHLDVGGSLDDGMVSLAMLARSAIAERFCYDDVPALRSHLGGLAKHLASGLS